MVPATESVAAAPDHVWLPWAAWHGGEMRSFAWPQTWTVEWLCMADAPALPAEAIERAFDRPMGSPGLEALATGRKRVAIAVEDWTRPSHTPLLLAPLVRRLTEAGVVRRDITIVMATGAHGSPRAVDLTRKVGSQLLKEVAVVTHNPFDDLTETGVDLAGVPVSINRAFAAADLRIGVGTVMPHPFADFSGGAKLVIPGLANLDVLERTHRSALLGFHRSSGRGENRFRQSMEAAVRRIGLHLTVNVAVNSRRAIAFASVGDMVEAHRAAATGAARIGRTHPPRGQLDAVIVNAYPKDGELLQIEAALGALHAGMLEWLAPGAPVVLTAACPRGSGTHHLFGVGGRLFRTASAKRSLADRPLMVFAPGVEEREARTIVWTGYRCCRTWDEVVAHLGAVLPARPRVGIIPCGPLQLAQDWFCNEAARTDLGDD